MEIQKLKSPNYIISNVAPIGICLHNTDVCSNDTEKVFFNDGGASAHFLITKNGKVVEFVDPHHKEIGLFRASKHAGISNYKNLALSYLFKGKLVKSMSPNSIGIENELLNCVDHKNVDKNTAFDSLLPEEFGRYWDKMTDIQVKALISLMNDLMLEFCILPHMIFTHNLCAGCRKWGCTAVNFPMYQLIFLGLVAYPLSDQTSSNYYEKPKDASAKTVFEFAQKLGFLTPIDFNDLYPDGFDVCSWKQYEIAYQDIHHKPSDPNKFEPELMPLERKVLSESENIKWCIASYQAFLQMPIDGKPSEALCDKLAQLLAIHKAIECGDFDRADRAGEFIKKCIKKKPEYFETAMNNLKLAREAAAKGTEDR